MSEVAVPMGPDLLGLAAVEAALSGAGSDIEVPLLAAQAAAWLDVRGIPDKPVYTAAQAVIIAAAVDHERMAVALELAVAGCQALHLLVRLDRPTAHQPASPRRLVALPLVDLTTEDDPDGAARRWMEAAVRRPFRLDEGPLCCFALLRLAAGRHVWFMSFHQLIMDAIGRAALVGRVAGIYAALGRSALPTLRPSPTLAEARAAEDRYLASPRAAHDRAYWMDRLATLPDPLVESDPTHSERTRSGRPERDAFTLAADRADALRATAARLGTSMARLLTTLSAIGFARLYDTDSLVLGLTLDRRVGPHRRHAIGPFSQTVPLLLAIDRRTSLAETIHDVARATARDQRHRHFPIHELYAPLGLGRRFADVTVSYLPTPDPCCFEGVPVRVENLSYGFPGPWTVTWVDSGPGGGLAATIDHDPGLIASGEGAHLAEALRCLLEAAPALQEVPVGRLPIMRDATRADILRWSCGPTVPVPAAATLASLFAEQAARSPHAPALAFGEVQTDYATLHAQAARLAARLAAAGVRRGSIVGLALPRTPAQLVALLAIHMAGGAYLPLDAGFPAERLAFMCADAGADLILTSRAQAALLPPLPCRVFRLDVEDDLPPPAMAAADAPAAGDLAYVLYTSGSTGRPKGVGVEHGSLVNLVSWVRSLVDVADLSGVLLSTALTFDISVIEIFLPLLFGGRIVMIENLLALPAAPARADVRLINTVPSLLEALLRVTTLPPGLRTLFLAGEALSRGLADRLHRNVPTLQVTNLYGPTEATVYASSARLHPGETGAPAIGRPIWNGALYVLDRDGGLLPAGASGELWIAGAPVARGYVGHESMTDARFRADPFRPGLGRMYRTGDRVRWRPARQLEFLGRLDDQIKINGVRIELGEIEAALGALPAIAAAAVAVRADDAEPRGLIGWLVAGPGAEPRDTAKLRAELRTLLPETMIPGRFVWVDGLPLTPSGKLDRRALRLPPPASPPRTPSAAIRTEIERAVADLWDEVLQTTGVSADDDFFDLGGDSLAAVNLLSQVEMRFQVRLTTDVLAQGLTVARLAQLIETRDSAELPGLALPLQPLGDGAPFYCVPGIGGDPTHLQALARRLGTARPFVVLRGGLLPEADGEDRIEDIAGRYVDAVLARHRDGPILLGGYSLGGAIAFEMAQQLVQRGRDAALLVMIDSRRPGWRLTARNAVPTIWQALRNLPDWAQHDLLPGGLTSFMRNLRRHSRIFGRDAAALDRVIDTSRYDPGQRETMARYQAAYMRYRPEPYAGCVAVLRARAQPLLWWFDDPTLGWRSLAQDLDLYQLPGNHATIMTDPIVAQTADRLRACIAQAEDTPHQRGESWILPTPGQ
jgi:amino acid adenylation domain-containing protein